MLRRILRDPLSLLLLATALFTFLIQSGELGTSDTTHRLQVTHSLWTGEAQVAPADYPEFGIHGRGGALYAWYGIGQSLFMLPADLAGSAAAHLPVWRAYVQSGADPAIRSIVVSMSTNILINVLTALVAFRFLALLKFRVGECVAGTLALLCATTHLHYAQNLMENNYILLLTLAGYALQYRWFRTGDVRSLRWGAAALGLNLLTRLTTLLDLAAVSCFMVYLLLFSKESQEDTDVADGAAGLSGKDAKVLALRTYLLVTVPTYASFLLLDRLYQYIRFDSWTNTYVTLLAREQRLANPKLPANFPFSGEWFASGIHSGMLGPLFSPGKSVFLFDPIFAFVLVLVCLVWRRLESGARAFIVSTLVLFLAYLTFYARYVWWAGDFAWGDRYVASAVELATLLALPMLLRYRKSLGSSFWRVGLGVTVLSVITQCASIAFWMPLEIYQTQDLGYRTPVVWLRFENIAAFVLGKRGAWGLDTPTMFDDPWDAAHITTWNFLPSLLRHIGAAPLWAVDVLDGVWLAVAFALMFVSVRLYSAVADPG